MENFSNTTIDTLGLPKYEDAEITPLHPSYMKIVYINVIIVFLITGAAVASVCYFIDEVKPYWPSIAISYAVIMLLILVLQMLGFKNKGFAFRTHDVIYRSGAIAITTTIIPYTRVQHVAQHEGVLSRWLGLAAVEIFTAGGTGSDIKIPGLTKAHAASIKKLLVGKIENQNTDVTVTGNALQVQAEIEADEEVKRLTEEENEK